MAYHPNIPTPTGVVQDELAQMRENFQHLAPLAQAIDELQAVSGLAPYVQAIRDSRIVEMGTNSNGTYVRWENGLQICWHRWQQYDFEGDTSYVVRDDFVIYNYPAAFVDIPAIFVSGEPWHWSAPWKDDGLPVDYGGITVSSAGGSIPTSTTRARLRFNYRIYRGRLEISVLAIGRWK